MMKKWILLAFPLALVLVCMSTGTVLFAAQANGNGIQWLSYEEGRMQGKAQNKKVFLVFHADWCRYCHQMEKETFQNPTVIAYVNQNFVPISVDLDKEQKIANEYQVRGLPSTYFLSERGKRIANRPGFISSKDMLNLLKYFGTDSYQSMSYSDFLKKSK